MKDDASQATSPTGEAGFRERAARFAERGWFQRLLDWFYGYDYFVSYRWSDGRVYALALAEQLEKDGFDCFLDSADYIKGDNWKRIGERALRKTTRLVLVGSPHVVRPDPPREPDDDPVLRELRIFTATGKRVIPINFEGSLSCPDLGHLPLTRCLDKDGLWIQEAKKHLAIGPSKATLEELRGSFDRERQSEKRARVLRYLILVFASLAFIAIAAAAFAMRQYFVAEQRRVDAEQKTRLSNAQRLVAEARLAGSDYPQRRLLLSAEAIRATLEDGVIVPTARQEFFKAILGCGGMPLQGHSDKVTALAISPDSKRLVAAGWNGTVTVWDLGSACAAIPSQHFVSGDGAITSIAVSADGNRVVYGGINRPAQICNLETKGFQRSFLSLDGHERGIYAIAISPDARWLITAGADLDERRNEQHTIRIRDLDVDPVKTIHLLTGHTARIESVRVSSDSRWLVSACDDVTDRTSRVWKLGVADPMQEVKILDTYSKTPVISPDGSWLAANFLGRIRIWDLQAAGSGNAVSDSQSQSEVLFDHQDLVTSLSISVDGRWLAAGSSNGSLRVWDSSEGKPQGSGFQLLGHSAGVVALNFSPDNGWLISGAGDGTARLWDMSADGLRKPSKVLRGHESNYVSHVAVSADSRWGVTAVQEDPVPRLWDLALDEPGKPASVIRPQSSQSPLMLSQKHRWLAIPTDDSVVLWDLAVFGNGRFLPSIGDKPERRFEIRWETTELDYRESADDTGMISWTVSSDGRWLVGFASKTIRIWRFGENTAISAGRKLDNQSPITTLGISPDGSRLATYGDDHKLRLWSLEDGRRILQIPKACDADSTPAAKIVFSPNNLRVVTICTSGTMTLWNLAPREPQQTCQLLSPPHGGADDVAISADGHWLFASGSNCVLWNLWLSTPDEHRIIPNGQNDRAERAEMSSDGRWLATSGPFGEPVRLWELPHLESRNSPRILPGSDRGAKIFAISGDSRWLVTADDLGKTHLWDLTVSNPERVSLELADSDSAIGRFVFSSDSRWLVASCWDGTTRLWDMRSHHLENSLFTLSSNISEAPSWSFDDACIAYVQDRVPLLVCSSRGFLEFTSLDGDGMIQQAHFAAGRKLTDDERKRFLE